MNKRNGELIVFACILLIIITASVLAPFLAPYPPNQIDMPGRLQGPSLQHPFGKDALGRDMLSRTLYGGRTSMILALAATILSMLLGMILGILAGYYGGLFDWAIAGISNIFQGLPNACLMVAIAGALGPGMGNLLLALVITNWAGFSRIIRAETLKLREEPYIEGLRCIGCGDLRLITLHIIPNMMNSALVLFTTRIGRSVLSIAALSFLGLGARPPTPDWSVMINDARMYYRAAPHLILAPGLCLFLLTLSINMLGDALRDHFDVKNQEAREY